MEEITEKIFIESGYPRVLLGALRLKQGMVIVDSPFRLEDVLAWQSQLSTLGGGMERLLVLLDAHIDRTMSVRAMETNVIAHEKAVDILHSRSAVIKAQELELDSDDTHNDLVGANRWCKLNMTYSDQVMIHWDENPVILKHKPGSHITGSWLIYEASKVIFIGDCVVENQPPFLALADIDLWLEELSQLLKKAKKDYLIISSRNGLITSDSIEKMAMFLRKTNNIIHELAHQEDITIKIPEAVSQLMQDIDHDPKFKQRYDHRLAWGLEQYIKRHIVKRDSELE